MIGLCLSSARIAPFNLIPYQQGEFTSNKSGFMSNKKQQRKMHGDDDKGLLWKLPVVKSDHFGKVGPAFGIGAGCGLGFGLGLLGGVGFGPVIPGFQVGFGFGAGCGVGFGFGYGVGKGIAQDEDKRYSNVGNPFRDSRSIISEDDITALVDDLVINTKKLIKATSKEIDKWRR